MLSIVPTKATGIGSTFPPAVLSVGVATTPPQALIRSVTIVRTNRKKRIFFIIYLLNEFAAY
jgi:hypothetical protein